MAQVIWNKLAQKEWRKFLLYGLNEFGETSAINFVKRTNDIVGRIRQHPKVGHPESLLRHKKNKTYRSIYIIGPLKIIYYYIESSDTVRIADVWDSRREPTKLAKRIR